MESLHWAYLVPLGIAFLFGAYLAADVEVSRAENSPTSRLRLMLLVFLLLLMQSTSCTNEIQKVRL